MIHTVNVTSVWSDPGVTAADAIDGDVTLAVSQQAGAVGPVDTTAATAPGTPFVIIYRRAAHAAAVARLLPSPG